MAFTVEDGSGVTGANSYCTLAFANEYFSDRGRDDWTGSDDEKQQALVRATDHVERRYSYRWKGTKTQDDDGDPKGPLSWPRSGVSTKNGSIDADEIPDQLKRACVEYARLALTRKELDPVPMETGADKTGKVVSKTETVGPISRREQYEDVSQRLSNLRAWGDKPPASSLVSGASLMEYPAADLYLEDLVRKVDITKDESGAVPVVEGGDACDRRFPDGWDERFNNNGGVGGYGGIYTYDRWGGTLG